MLRRSSVTGVRRSVGKDSSEGDVPASGVSRLVCVVGDSRVEVRNSEFNKNGYTALGVFDQAHLLLVASTIANNSIGNPGDGGGVYIEGGANVTVTGRSRVHGNNASGDGGGLFVKGHAVLRVDGNSSVTANSAEKGYGGGLAAYGLDSGAGDVTLTDGTSVQGNTAAKGGGVYAGNYTAVSCIGCIIANNTAKFHPACATLYRQIRWACQDASGGGLYIDNARVTLAWASSVHDHKAVNGSGGGLSVNYEASVFLTDGSIVMGNTASGVGGGLAVRYSNATLTGGTIVQGNTAGESAGGVFSMSSNLTLTNGSSVHDNTAALSGGGLVLDDSEVTITGASRVQVNKALNGTGGGLDVLLSSNVTISNHSTVSNNSCWGGVGGGVAVQAVHAAFDARGRVIDVKEGYGDASRVIISNSTVSNNTSIGSAGGGLAVAENGTAQLVNGSVVLHNTAVNSSGGGGVLLGNGILLADDSVGFANNVVGKGCVGSTIAAFDNCTLDLPRGGRLSKCSVGVYLGWSTCQAGETQQHDMCVCCPQHTFSFTNVSCEACPPNGNCPGGSLVQPLPGYWSLAPTSVQII